VGTTNEEQFLQDATGGRRFWPVTVTKRIDIAALSAERDQLFAEAVAAYRAGEPWHLDPAFEAEHARPVQEAARVSDSWAEKVAAWLAMGEDDDFREDGETVSPRMEVTLPDVLEGALAISPAQHTMATQKRASTVMRDLGWTKHHTRKGKVWRSPEWESGE
jgi:predicted P-loop ATPase